jgi:4'-phosphopantetheinyl transferase
MLYVYECDNTIETEYFKKLEVLLDSERKSKMDKYRFQKDRNLCLLAFALLRLALWKEYGMDYVPKLCVSPYGKPYFYSEKLSFNFSHCDNAVACALDSQGVGVDVQDYSESISTLKERILTPLELKCACNIKEVSRFWTLKEAYGKYYGHGLNYRFSKKDFSTVRDDYCWQSFESLKVMSCKFENYSLSAFTSKPIQVSFVTLADLLNLTEVLAKSS